ncbi:MAG: insulinase family protein, partial [Planctomycetota bacterium]
AKDPLRFAARLLSYVLGDDSGSRMFWSLVDPGLAEYAGASTYEFDGSGIMMTYLCCSPSDTQRNLERIVEIQRDLDTNGITQDELDLVKSKVCSQIVRRAERPSSRLFSVGNNWLQRQAYKSVRETITGYQSVTVDDLMKVLQEHPLSKTMTVSVGP